MTTATRLVRVTAPGRTLIGFGRQEEAPWTGSLAESKPKQSVADIAQPGRQNLLTKKIIYRSPLFSARKNLNCSKAAARLSIVLFSC